MFSERVGSLMERENLLTAPPETTVSAAALLMAVLAVVLTGKGDIVEIQATGEKRGFSEGEFESLFSLARKGIGELCIAQRVATGG